MHHGNKALGSVIPMSGIEKMSKELEAMTKQNMLDAAAAVKFKQSTGLSFRQVFGLAPNPLAQLLPVLMVGLPIMPASGRGKNQLRSRQLWEFVQQADPSSPEYQQSLEVYCDFLLQHGMSPERIRREIDTTAAAIRRMRPISYSEPVPERVRL